MDWNDSDWIAVAWCVGGRTDTNFAELRGLSVLFFYKQDAEIAVQARQLYQKMVADVKDIAAKKSAVYA